MLLADTLAESKKDISFHFLVRLTVSDLARWLVLLVACWGETDEIVFILSILLSFGLNST